MKINVHLARVRRRYWTQMVTLMAISFFWSQIEGTEQGIILN